MSDITYRNKQEFEQKLTNMKDDGISKLHILADFDRTLTKSFVNGEKSISLVSVLRSKEAHLGGECAMRDTELLKKYHPIEVDPNVSIEEKKEKMIEWWTSSFNLFIKYGLSKSSLKKLAKTKIIELRDGYQDFSNILYKNDVPLVIISASGIGKLSIQYFLEERGVMNEGVYIISNDFDWDENGKALAFKKPIIHSFNKSETIVSEFPEINEKVKDRTNIILLGDSLGDHHMVDGFEYDNLINIGFLNHNEDELMEEYKKRYDIVITGDGSFDIVNEILGDIY